MSTALDPDVLLAGWEYLRRFPKPTQTRGEAYRRHGAVQSLACRRPLEEYTALVEGSGGEPHTVTLRHSVEDDGTHDWLARCDCPIGSDCKHGYAALAALLERLTDDPASLHPAPPAGKGRSSKAAKPNPPAEPKAVSLLVHVRTRLDRALTAAETRYLLEIESNFREVKRSGALMIWNANSLGFRPHGSSWDRLKVWPKVPASAIEFWNQLAYAAIHIWGSPVPEWMEPATSLETSDPVVLAWRREEAVQRWTTWLDGFNSKAQEEISPTAVDLRVRLLPGRAAIDIRHDLKAEFKELKAAAGRDLALSMADGSVAMTPNAGIIWAILGSRVQHGDSPSLRYGEVSADRTLARLLRMPAIQSSVVTADGYPYRFATERLRWQLTEPDGSTEEYRLNLVLADGSPTPPLLFCFTGSPGLAATADTIFEGPTVPFARQGLSSEIRIPAPALERGPGLEFLRGLQVALPARVSNRVQVIPYQIKFHCELGSSGFSGSSEYCRVTATAVTTDQHQRQVWNGSFWVDEFQAVTPKKPKPSAQAQPVIYDRSALAEVARLLAPLNLRWNGWQACGELRVTKRFPEEFAAWREALPPEVEVELVGELASFLNGALAGSVRLSVAEAGIDWFDLSVLLNVTETDLTSDEIKLLLNAKGGYVRLKDKGWRRLQFNLSEEEDERLARLGLNPRELTAEPQRLHVLQLADPSARQFLPEEQYERVERRASELKARVAPELPAGLQAELRPYQREGFNFLCYLSTNRFGGILADDMGLGKTLQTLAWLLWLRGPDGPDAGSPGPILVVCPKSVMDNWDREARRFAPSIKTRLWAAGDLDELPGQTGAADVHILNYNQLRLLGESLAPVPWQAVVLDEGQYIKNPSSQTAQIARSLRARHRLVLSGTPIENRLMDLWSLMSFAMPGALGSRAQFGKMFGGSDDPFARGRLAARVRPFLIRRTKTQVARDLPERIEEDLLCTLEGEQKALYRAELKVAQQILLKIQTHQQLAEQRFHFLTSLLRLRQICCHPRLVQENSEAPSAKQEALIEQLEPLMDEGQKVLVFSQFVSMLDLLKAALQERGWPIYYLAGDTENRGELVEQFQSAPGPAVFLISLKAGGFGLNLTAAGYVVLYDPWWNPAVENQAIDRTHRIGQQQNVIAYRLLMKDSIEEKIRALQKQKKSLAEDVLGEEKFAQSLSLDDLRFLVAD